MNVTRMFDKATGRLVGLFLPEESEIRECAVIGGQEELKIFLGNPKYEFVEVEG